MDNSQIALYLENAKQLATENRSFSSTVSSVVCSIVEAANLGIPEFEDVSELNEKFQVFELFSFFHQSDEDCSAFIACYDNEPVALHIRVGDKSDYSDGTHILSAEIAQRSLLAYLQIQAKSALDKLRSQERSCSIGELLAEECSNYVQLVSDHVVTLTSPRWHVSFEYVLKNHVCWIEQEGVLTRIQKFVSWKHPNMQSWQGAGANLLTVEFTDGQQLEVDARDILIWTGKAETAPSNPVEELSSKSTYWKLVVEQHDYAHELYVFQHLAGSALSRFLAYVAVPRGEAQDRYVSELASQQEGLFTREALGSLPEGSRFINASD